MQTRSLVTVVGKIAALALLAIAGFACGGAQKGRINPDTPALPYQAPDIDELTGIDPDEEPEESAEGSAQNPQK